MAGEWVELRLMVPETDPLSLEPLDEAVLTVAPGGFVVEGSDAPPGDDPKPEPGWVRYRVYVGAAELEGARARLTSALSRWPQARLASAPLPQGWRDRWREWFFPIEVSPRLVVAPPWRAAEVEAQGREVLVVEPGMAFGTGQHETTRLCLEALDAMSEAQELPAEVLDVGCGTGVLAIAAARLGATKVYGNDVDPQAPRAANDNAEVNGVADRVRFDATPIERVEGTWPLVVANIMTHILLSMREALAARVAPGGTLLLSGILRDQVPEILGAFVPLGLEHVETVARNDWVRVHLRRR
ncbi:MAG: 50S ribosomal protein L11 methyltransferase [Proteobacteria bacterium]|nr:MAG: 50S ribosomal protein L11 methyltransferase [Pseudomonadota bacterium]